MLEPEVLLTCVVTGRLIEAIAFTLDFCGGRCS